jgi:putative hydrolase of the HAD superfamily
MLKGLSEEYRMGLLSNFTHAPAAREILDVTGLTACFDTVIISGEIGYRKPHRMVFDRLVMELGVSSKEMIYVGDDPEPDITGARGAGIRPVWTTYVIDRGMPYAPGYLSRERDDDDEVPRISDWSDLKTLLSSLKIL